MKSLLENKMSNRLNVNDLKPNADSPTVTSSRNNSINLDRSGLSRERAKSAGRKRDMTKTMRTALVK